MHYERLTIPDLILIRPDVYTDERGYFLETWNAKRYAELGVASEFVQDNESRSRKNVLRGMHYQLQHPQGKLVRVVEGEVFDVAVDIRRNSPTFGKWAGAKLTASNKEQLWIPPGFAHGYCVLTESVIFSYKCTGYYLPEDERSLAWNDPAIGIEWPVETPILSARDTTAPLIRDAELPVMP